ncbi:MAG: ATP phosphoribosyltransferase regulatory subunit [Candidatus Nephthysia bennettiae]|uniref:ATP phosphoribosyltransferase regulatory subunit n=1 Tax=Candidatus Nephthysia bennettiae TaxID=3127016 RepID=A0A934K6S5_9BACT|nr:ATP phosphoribosyltransferase regulatory subunit [Candidatus Dormibacteraeota bacterium]MBJ7613871.1 ATP phosphoribosyltransferase regulatory subunit [Candidatus Dormibacteraeota bacterium]PZR95627.1 MAG: ATP phosphoribosyltransferase regulatory subunit [Candidatus Dormibacteraeota bacterium]
MRSTQEAVLAEMRRWGYRYVVTPTLESLDVLALGLESDQRRRLFKLSDADGSLLALVGERTVPVARLAAGKLHTAPLPLRLCYAGPVLTNDPDRFTRRREAYQVGAELLGASGAVADAEVIAMAARCLDAAGLRDYQVDVGHSEFFQGLMDGLELPADIKSGIKEVLSRRDFVGLEELLARTPLKSAEHELLLRFPALRGQADILDAAGSLVRNRRSEQALEELSRVHSLLGAYGLGGTVNLDLGAIRDFDYYTGVIFEGYGQGLGSPLAQGGRYDRLLQRFGRPAAATGFMIHLDLLGLGLRRSGRAPELTRLDTAIAWSAAGLPGALRLGASLRLFGMRTVVDTQPRGMSGARAWAHSLGAHNLLHVDARGLVGWVPAGGRLRRLPPEQVVARLAGSSS